MLLFSSFSSSYKCLRHLRKYHHTVRFEVQKLVRVLMIYSISVSIILNTKLHIFFSHCVKKQKQKQKQKQNKTKQNKTKQNKTKTKTKPA